MPIAVTGYGIDSREFRLARHCLGPGKQAGPDQAVLAIKQRKLGFCRRVVKTSLMLRGVMRPNWKLLTSLPVHFLQGCHRDASMARREAKDQVASEAPLG